MISLEASSASLIRTRSACRSEPAKVRRQSRYGPLLMLMNPLFDGRLEARNSRLLACAQGVAWRPPLHE